MTRSWIGFAGRAAGGCLIFLGGFAPAVSAMQNNAESPVAAALAKADASVKAIVDVPADKRNFDNTIGAIDDLLTRLDTETNFIQFMFHVSTSEAERNAGRAAEEAVANWKIDLTKREDLYKAVSAFAATSPKLEGEPKKLLSELMREYRRAGMDLSPEKREEVKKLQKEITLLGQKFQENIATDKTTVLCTRAELDGMSDEYLGKLKRDGEKYVITMDYPTYTPLLEMCKVEPTREKVWRTYKCRGGKANVELIEKILKMRAQAAALLGYANTVDYENEIRMSKNQKNIQEFYDKLRPIVRRKAKLDLDEFTSAKREETKNASATLKPWDQPYYENWLLKNKYAVDSEKVKEYFPIDACMNGLFNITQVLYGIEYRDVTKDTAKNGRIWHPQVRLYEVWDKKSGQQLGDFYIDLYPRENKFTHAACWGLVTRKKWADGTVQKPVAALVCNFPEPSGDKPALMPHKDVETLFHEFGHCLHNILTEADYNWFAGTNVARDFVEAPSQMFENWVWDKASLKTFAKHYKTGELLPDKLIEDMIKAKYLGSGLFVERQFYYGLTDLAFHGKTDGVVDTIKVADELFPQVEQYAAVPGIYYHASFGHLIGYNAGYYGYMWSLVYASDMFQRFKELGMLNPEAGMYYRKKILARGGTIDEMEMVRDYLGREPNMEAFLEHLGLTK